MSSDEIRKGVKEGLINYDLMGRGFVLIMIECIIFGISAWLISRNYILPAIELNPSISSWIGWGTGLTLFFLLFTKIKGFLIFIFSAGWGFIAYAMAFGIVSEVSGNLESTNDYFSTSPIPYVIGIVVLLISVALHKSFTE